MSKIKEAYQTDLNVLMDEATGHISNQFVSELIPGYFSDEFVIHDYTRIRQNEEVVFSPPLKMHGLTWRLKVYPNGNGIAQGAYLSVFLEMTEGLLEPSKYEYRVQMVREPGAPIVREFASDFQEGECWGYNRFFKIDNLERDGFLKNDSLKLSYFVRAPSFVQQARDQAVYIQRLEKELETANAKIAELQDPQRNARFSCRLSSGNEESEEEGIAVREEKSSDSRGDQDQLDAPRLQGAEDTEESQKEEEEDDQVLVASPLLMSVERSEEMGKEEENEQREQDEKKEKEVENQSQKQEEKQSIERDHKSDEEGEEFQEERKEVKKVQQVKLLSICKSPPKDVGDKSQNAQVLKIRKKQVVCVSGEASYSPKLGRALTPSELPSPKKQT